MNTHNSIPTLTVAFAVLGFVTWVAAAHPANGSLYTAVAPQIERHDVAQSVAPTQTRSFDAR